MIVLAALLVLAALVLMGALLVDARRGVRANAEAGYRLARAHLDEIATHPGGIAILPSAPVRWDDVLTGRVVNR